MPGALLSMPSLSWTKPEAHHLHGVIVTARSAAGPELAGRRSVTRPGTAAARRPTRIVKLIDHAKSTDAAHGRSTLLKGVEAAIGATAKPTTRILGTPSSIVAGQVIFTASPLPICFIAERILCRGDAGPQKRRTRQHYQCKPLHLDLPRRRNLTRMPKMYTLQSLITCPVPLLLQASATFR